MEFSIAIDSVGRAFEKAYCNNDHSLVHKIFNTNEQENEMNTKVFEYCIIDWDDEGNSVLIVGPALITVDAKETHTNIALVRIGQLHSTEITVTSKVQIRPFC